MLLEKRGKKERSKRQRGVRKKANAFLSSSRTRKKRSSSPSPPSSLTPSLRLSFQHSTSTIFLKQALAQPQLPPWNATALKSTITMKNKTIYTPTFNASAPLAARQVPVLDVGATSTYLREYVLKKVNAMINSMSGTNSTSNVQLAICKGEFALCAASTCTPTGGNITLNNGKVKPEVACRCPILRGPSLADLTGGNMQGSCRPPAPGTVWSLFFPRLNYPQEATGFTSDPKKNNVVFQSCSASLMQGANAANCFSFLCEKEPGNNGIAVCKCPIGQSPANTTFLTEAGQGNPAACFQSPVSLPVGVAPV